MNNIKTLMEIINKIDAPLLFHMAHTSKRIYAYIFFNNKNLPISFSNDVDILIEESIYPLLIEFNIKIEHLKTSLIEIQKVVVKLGPDELRLIKGIQMAKDKNNIWYNVHFNENQLEYWNQIDLFFQGQKPTWDLLNFDYLDKQL